MLHYLALIPGPWFLVLFWSLSGAVMALIRYAADAAPKTGRPDPDPSELGPQRLAALRGGAFAVIRTLTFKLWKLGALGIEEKKQRTYFSSNSAVPAAATASSVAKGQPATQESNPGSRRPWSPAERLILDACATPKMPGQLLKAVQKSMDQVLEGDYRALKELGFLKGPDAHLTTWKMSLVGLIPLLVLGFAKLGLGIARDKPVLFLVISLLVMPIAFLFIVKPWRRIRITAAGKRFLKRSQIQLDWVRSRMVSPEVVEGIVLLMALHGMVVLGRDSSNGPFQRGFVRSASAGSGCSAGCGSMADFSSGSGSDGGGGCSGGDGGGGGGCGGCGGG